MTISGASVVDLLRHLLCSSWSARKKDLTQKLTCLSAITWPQLTVLNHWLLRNASSLWKHDSPFSSVLHATVLNICDQISVSAEMV